MKLIIQIPCFNEAKVLPRCLADLPANVPGFDVVELLVIDDGSADGTYEVARAHGVHHVVRHTRNLGLARAFETGLTAAIRLGADVIVNTDADNQYCADDIPHLVAPILNGSADMVIGERPISELQHFSPGKKFLQKVGSAVVRWVSRTQVADAPSGFRAISKPAAVRMHVFNDYTYTLETVIQAGQQGLAVLSVPIRVNGPTRQSRLIKSIPDYIGRSIGTMFRIFVIYRPLQFFMWLSVLIAMPGFGLALRFLVHFLRGEGSGMVQSLILSALLIGLGFLMLMVGLIADLIAVNRKLLEKNHIELKEMAERGRLRDGGPMEPPVICSLPRATDAPLSKK